jgi:hypothetical protein
MVIVEWVCGMVPISYMLHHSFGESVLDTLSVSAEVLHLLHHRPFAIAGSQWSPSEKIVVVARSLARSQSRRRRRNPPAFQSG